jgi:hypothetical protein
MDPDHAYGVYQDDLYQGGAYQDGGYQDGMYHNEGSDPVMPQTDEMEAPGDDVEPRQQKERRRELDDDDEEGDPEEDDEEEEDDDEDPGRKKKRAKVSNANTCGQIKQTPVHSIGTNGPLPVVSLISKLKSVMRTKRTRTKKT